MRADAGIPNTPPLQRYKLRPKSLESRNSSETVSERLRGPPASLQAPYAQTAGQCERRLVGWLSRASAVFAHYLLEVFCLPCAGPRAFELLTQREAEPTLFVWCWLLQGVDVAAADALARGLMHLGSYYVNETCSTVPPGLSIHSDDMPSLNSSTHSSGSGDSLRKQPQQQQQHSNGSSNGLAGTYRPAPRTSYIVSKLYNMPSQVRCTSGCSQRPWFADRRAFLACFLVSCVCLRRWLLTCAALCLLACKCGPCPPHTCRSSSTASRTQKTWRGSLMTRVALGRDP